MHEKIGVAAGPVNGLPPCRFPRSPNTSEPDGEDEDAEVPAELTVTLAEGALELSSAEIAGGAVHVTFENDTEGSTEVDLTQVEAGTDEATFVEGFSPVLAGGPFPDFAITNAGLSVEGGDSGESTSPVTTSSGPFPRRRKVRARKLPRSPARVPTPSPTRARSSSITP